MNRRHAHKLLKPLRGAAPGLHSSIGDIDGLNQKRRIMNREEAKELLPVIKAYADGKPIQYRAIDGGYWYDIDDDKDVDWDRYEFRIKPEAKYRPFASAEECWNEMLKHQPFGWVVDKEGEHILIVHLIDTGVCGGDDLEGFCYGSAVNVYQFTDGAPFGIKEGGEE